MSKEELVDELCYMRDELNQTINIISQNMSDRINVKDVDEYKLKDYRDFKVLYERLRKMV